MSIFFITWKPPVELKTTHLAAKETVEVENGGIDLDPLNNVSAIRPSDEKQRHRSQGRELPEGCVEAGELLGAQAGRHPDIFESEALINAGRSSGLRLETRLPSSTTSRSTNSAPAFLMS